MARKKRPTEADLEARRQMRENAERTRRLAEKAQDELDRRNPQQSVPTAVERVSPREARRRMRENAERTRQLAEKAQAELDARKPRDSFGG
jgi:hypothetical protein